MIWIASFAAISPFPVLSDFWIVLMTLSSPVSMDCSKTGSVILLSASRMSSRETGSSPFFAFCTASQICAPVSNPVPLIVKLSIGIYVSPTRIEKSFAPNAFFCCSFSSSSPMPVARRSPCFASMAPRPSSAVPVTPAAKSSIAFAAV